MTYLSDAVLILSCFALVFGPILFIVWHLDRRDHQLTQKAPATVRAASVDEIAAWSADHRAVLALRLSQIRLGCLEEVETADVLHRDAAMTHLRAA
ncbi:hypothetical protein ACH9D2_18800 [Kocuria sp. M4R2S49]|uniref:hypothetical protein n=1 Tax=Kocuria rhizosphaericola TaxID=3376284 RepID=UPI003798EBFB